MLTVCINKLWEDVNFMWHYVIKILSSWLITLQLHILHSPIPNTLLLWWCWLKLEAMEYNVKAMMANLTLEDHLLWSSEPCPLQIGCWTWCRAFWQRHREGRANAATELILWRSGKSVLFKGETSGTKQNYKTDYCFQTLSIACENNKSVPNSKHWLN